MKFGSDPPKVFWKREENESILGSKTFLYAIGEFM